MKKHINTMRRVAKGLKLAAMLLFAIVAYAALLKRGKATVRFFAIAFAGVCCVAQISCASLPALSRNANGRSQNSSASPEPVKQIYTRSNRTERAETLGLTGQAAYIVSSAGSRSGILVIDVTSGSPAARFGITPGDVLLTLDQRVVTTSRDADRILSDTSTGRVKVSFAHPSDAGLQLYNTDFLYSHAGAIASSGITSSGTITSQSMAHASSGASVAALSSQISSAESMMLDVINSDRAGQGVGPVVGNSALASLARAHAQDMAARNFFSHSNPDGLNPQDRANRANVGPVSENIAFAKGILDVAYAAKNGEREMMSEPPNQQNHRGTILNPENKSVGVGIAVSKEGVFYMTQEFSTHNP